MKCVKSGSDFVKANGEVGGTSWSLGDKAWRWQGMPAPRPLYNVHLLAKYPNATVLIVEGEKCADHANKFLNLEKTISLSWSGGANGVKLSDWATLKNRNVIYWQDNDTAGKNAMQSIHSIIKDLGGVRRWVYIPSDLPNKWDVADRLDWTTEILKDFIIKNLGPVPKIELSAPLENSKTEKNTKSENTEKNSKNQLPPPKNNLPPISDVINNKPVPVMNDLPLPDNSAVSNNNPPSPPPKKTNDPTNNKYFKILGYEKDETGKLVYYFFSHDAKSVVKLSPSAMTKSNLITLANLNYWEEFFPGGGSTKINIDAVQQFLIGQSHKVGIFMDKYIRGRGAWEDDGEIIVHSGDRIIKNDQYINLRDYASNYIYEIGENIGFEITEQLKKSDAVKILDKMSWLSWERGVNAYLLAGWCVIAPFCGVLNWRPHIWLTGESGSGKSHVMNKMIRKLMGYSAILVQGKTTEPAIRGLLQSDARPVLFDEGDVEDQHDKDRIQAVLSFARSSSDKDGASIAKGTKEGGARTSDPKTCFAISSVGVQLNQRADKSRFTVLGLTSFEGKKTTEDFTKFANEWDDLVTPEFVSKLHYRTIKLLPKILKNANVFAGAATEMIGNRRLGDQLGSMLAGAFSLTSEKLISHQDAIKWLQEKDWTEEKSLEQQKDQYQLLAFILGTMLRVELEFTQVERTIGELIAMAYDGSNTAKDRLRRFGIIVTENRILIANTSHSLKKVIDSTPWANNHNKILERIDGATRENSREFYPGHPSRSVSLPIELVIKTIQNNDIIVDELPF
jgi:putative DNA primase/helicase